MGARAGFAAALLQDQAGRHSAERLSPAAAYGSQFLLHAAPQSACRPDPTCQLAHPAGYATALAAGEAGAGVCAK
jgi:hypothetical protein